MLRHPHPARTDEASVAAGTLSDLFAGDATSVELLQGIEFPDLTAAGTLTDRSSAVHRDEALQVGKLFDDVTAAIDFVQAIALKQRKQLNEVARGSKYRKLKCADDNCGFFVLLKPNGSRWHVAAMSAPHAPSCTSRGKPKPRHLAHLPAFKDAVAKHPKLPAAQLAKIVQERTGLIVMSSTADSARKHVIEQDAMIRNNATVGGNREARGDALQDVCGGANESDQVVHQRSLVGASLHALVEHSLQLDESRAPSCPAVSQQPCQPCTLPGDSISPRTVDHADIGRSSYDPFAPVVDAGEATPSSQLDATRSTSHVEKRPTHAARLTNDAPSKRQRVSPEPPIEPTHVPDASTQGSLWAEYRCIVERQKRLLSVYEEHSDVGHSSYHPFAPVVDAREATTARQLDTSQVEKRPTHAARLTNDAPSQRQRVSMEPPTEPVRVPDASAWEALRDERLRVLERMKDLIAMHEVPARQVQGSSLYTAFHGMMHRPRESTITWADDEAIAFANGHRRRLNGRLLDHFGNWKTRKVLGLPPRASDGEYEALRFHLRESMDQCCAKPAPRELWGGELQIKAAVLAYGHPITVLDAHVDGCVKARVFFQDKEQPDTVDVESISAPDACHFILALMDHKVVPHVLVRRPDPCGDDRYSALRIDDNKYREWTSTPTECNAMKERARGIVQSCVGCWRHCAVDTPERPELRRELAPCDTVQVSQPEVIK